MAGRNEKKNITKSKIVNYIINNKITSKAELAQNLSLSMPTVLSNVNELIERNMVIQDGDYTTAGFWVIVILVIAFVVIFLLNIITAKNMKHVSRW